MNPCKEVSAHSIHRQLDSIAEQVAAELLQQYQNGGDSEQEAKNSPAFAKNGVKLETSKSPTSAKMDQCGVRDCSKDLDRCSTKTADCEERRASSSGLQLPTEVILDGINTVLYSRLRFSSPSMDQYYNLENSFIDKVWEWDHDLSYDVVEMLNQQNDWCCVAIYTILGVGREERFAHHNVHCLPSSG